MAEIHNGYVSLLETDSPSPLLKSPSSSFKDLEAGVAEAAKSASRRTHRHPAMVRGWARRSYRTLGSLSPRSGGSFSRGDEGHHHFLDECFLCKKPLGGHRDIFMYRGDMPFCSEECRQEQIDIDEDKENNWTMKTAASRVEQKPNASQAIHIRVAGTIVAG